MRQVIDEICRMQKGHWGLIDLRYRSSRQTDFYDALNRSFRGYVYQVDCAELPGSPADVSAFVTTKLEDSLTFAQQAGKKSICFGLLNFDRLDVHAQVQSLIATRAKRESLTGVALITVLTGCWNRHRLQEVWRREYSSTSPCPDQKCIEPVGIYTRHEFQKRLQAEGRIPNHPAELDEIASEALLEFTGGDELLVTEVLDILRMSERSLREYRDTMKDVVGSDDVENGVRRRLKNIGERGREFLHCLMGSERVRVDPSDSDIEDLRLAGFIRLKRLADFTLATWNCSLMEEIFRHNWQRLLQDGTTVTGFVDLQRPSLVINCHAYRIVLEIETLLRNTMVRVLSSFGSDGWRESIRHVKIGGNPADVHLEEIHHHGRRLVEAVYPHIDFSVLPEKKAEMNDPDSVVEEKKNKPKMESVVHAALNWKQRCTQECWVRPVEESLPQFMTTGALENVYLGKHKSESLLKSCFNSREHAKTFFTKFARIRSAVMHNHSLGMPAIQDLVNSKVELLTRLGRPTHPPE